MTEGEFLRAEAEREEENQRGEVLLRNLIDFLSKEGILQPLIYTKDSLTIHGWQLAREEKIRFCPPRWYKDRTFKKLSALHIAIHLQDFLSKESDYYTNEFYTHLNQILRSAIHEESL